MPRKSSRLKPLLRDSDGFAFTRLHASTHEGHGLGLSIVRTAVERLGGQARAGRSAAGGARFSIELPDLAGACLPPGLPAIVHRPVHTAATPR